jgi:hypothetical protein
MARRYGEEYTGDEGYVMETEGSRNGRMGVFNLGDQGCQRVVEPISQ